MKTTTAKTRRIEPDLPITSSPLKYQQVKDHLLREITEGRLKPGDALPPERILAKRLGRAVHTIRHALSELTEENVVHRIQGKGTFVRDAQPAVKKQTLDVFALVLPEVSGPLYPSLIKGFIEAAAEAHHQVLVCDTHMDTHIQGDMILQLINKNTAGVAIIPTITPMPAYQFNVLRSQRIPVVFCHRRPPGLAAPLITWPWKEVARRAGAEIVGRGHRRVGFVAAGPYPVSIAYLEGLQEILAENNVELPDRWVLHYALDQDSQGPLVEMLSAPDRPTAVFCNDTSEGERVFLEAMHLGLRVPQDLSIVGFGCSSRDGVLSQRLTAVTIDEVELGRQAAILIGQMQAGQRTLDSEETILAPLGFAQGQSLAPAPSFRYAEA